MGNPPIKSENVFFSSLAVSSSPDLRRRHNLRYLVILLLFLTRPTMISVIPWKIQTVPDRISENILGFNFILGLNLFSFVWNHYHILPYPKTRSLNIEFKPRIQLNLNQQHIQCSPRLEVAGAVSKIPGLLAFSVVNTFSFPSKGLS